MLPAPDLLRLYEQAATISGLKRVWFVGPFGQRVSFASQQRRALNTVLAAGVDGLFDPQATVAIVGGGIAGLMVAAALISKKCNVTLFERGVGVALKQRETLHRYVHPTVNFWPEKQIKATTEFPFLDWYEGPCCDVVHTILAEWNSCFRDRLTAFRPMSEIVGLSSVAGHVQLEIDQAGKPGGKSTRLSEKYTHVFVTTGFGAEKTLSPKDVSYWETDHLEDTRDAGVKSFVVGGSGDGGLIETLRLVQKPFDLGTVCLRIIEEIDSAGRSNALAEIERELRAASADPDKASLLYHERCQAYLKTLSSGIRERMRLRHAGVSVKLVGRLEHPYSTSAAPIHRLMICAAIEDGVVEYVRGTLEAAGDKMVVVEHSGSTVALADDAYVVVRMGPRRILDKLLDDRQLDALAQSQSALADFLEPVPVSPGFFPPCGKVPSRAESKKFAKFRLPQANAYLYKKFESQAGLSSDGGPPRYVASRIDGMDFDETNAPSELFGFGLAWESEPEVERL